MIVESIIDWRLESTKRFSREFSNIAVHRQTVADTRLHTPHSYKFYASRRDNETHTVHTQSYEHTHTHTNTQRATEGTQVADLSTYN